MKVIGDDAVRRPHLFMSHSSKNKDFVIKLSEDLNVCEIDVWLDDWEIKVGDSLYYKLSQAINQSKFIALVISNEFINSKWAMNELKQALAREQREDYNLILPIIIDDVKIPTFIEDKIYIDFTSDYYSGFSQLVGSIHGLDSRAVNEGVRTLTPKSINGCIKVLRFCGFEPYMIVSKNVFKEILSSGGRLYQDNRVRFNPFTMLHSASLRTKYYLKRAIKAWHDH